MRPPCRSAGLASRARLGALSECLAALWLQAHGCSVVARRRSIGGVEVDLLMRTRRLGLVVEVKSRSRSDLNVPAADLVSSDQRRRLQRAAEFLSVRLELPVRVDLVEIRWGRWPLIRWHRGPWAG